MALNGRRSLALTEWQPMARNGIEQQNPALSLSTRRVRCHLLSFIAIKGDSPLAISKK